MIDAYFAEKKQTILLTGGSGFVGFVLLKSLLKKCKQLSIILPVRKASAFSPEILNDPRVLIIEGFDLQIPGFGLDKRYLELLKSVSVVYHCAAVVQWNLPFHQHIRINTLASIELLEMVQSDNLKLFCSLSTTAVAALPVKNVTICSKNVMMEDIDKRACRMLQDSLKTMTSPSFDASNLFPGVNAKTIGRSYYAYSKLVMEHVLYLKRPPKATILIARLCNIDAAVSFPVPGFAHLYHGAGTANLKDGLIGSRLLPDTFIFPTNSYPVDIAVNLLLAHTAYDSQLTEKNERFRVINFESNHRNPVSILDRFEASSHIVGPVTRLPLDKAMDLLLERTKKGDVKAKINLKILKWYVPNSQMFYRDEKLRSVLNLMSDSELQRFPCDIAAVDWKSTLRNAANLCHTSLIASSKL